LNRRCTLKQDSAAAQLQNIPTQTQQKCPHQSENAWMFAG